MIELLSSVVTFAVVVGAYFFLDAHGMSVIRTRRMLKKVRGRFDEFAVSTGAKATARPHYGRGTMLLFYEYPDGNYLMLEVNADDFQVRMSEDRHPNSKHALGRLAMHIASIERRAVF